MLFKAVVVLFLIGVLDIYLLDGINFDPIAAEDVGIRRQGLHQGKNEAYFLYFFIAHVYDNFLNPWHWNEEMRASSLTSGDFGLGPGLKVADVGCGTGFTTIGVVEQGVAAADIHMLDQSPQQLSKARVKPELQNVATITEGDAENLPANWTGKFDRYTSAGSIEYWPHPQMAIDEAARILRPGGKAMIIGPIRATNPVSRFFADLWYLFPEEREYESWFSKAGFTDIKIHQVTPEWYNGDRSHGLIMGCAIVGTKPDDWAQPERKVVEAAAAAAAAPSENDGIISLLMALPRFVLGSVGGLYYALVPMLIFAKNIWFGGSVAVTAVFLLSPIVLALWLEVLPSSWSPLSAGPELYGGIANLYNSSSQIWEKVWGEHMHTGFYTADKVPATMTKADHIEAQHEMMLQLFQLWDSLDLKITEAAASGTAIRVLDAGCGVGGSSRFIYRALSDIADADGHRDLKIEVVGITLSQYQRDRAAKLTADDGDIPSGSVTFQVANALDTNFPNEHFDCVWSLESGEHMPDKDAWLTEVERVLTPGGTFLCASWCRRETDKTPLSAAEQRLLGRICKNYSLPAIVGLSTYRTAAAKLGLEGFEKNTTSWNESIKPFWPAVISSALNPKTLLLLVWYGNWTTIKGAITAFLMQEGFAIELLVFGVFTVTKPVPTVAGNVRRSSRARTPGRA